MTIHINKTDVKEAALILAKYVLKAHSVTT